jgi:hypothetical protein
MSSAAHAPHRGARRLSWLASTALISAMYLAPAAAQETTDEVPDYRVLGPILPFVVASLGSGDQPSRRRMETSSVRVW